MPERLEDIIEGMSSAALDMYKDDLRLRLKDMSPSALTRFRGIPELGDLFAPEVARAEVPSPEVSLREERPWDIITAPDVPLWQRTLGAITLPFSLAQEYVVEPWAAAVTSPWWRDGEEVSFASLMPGGKARKAYEEWEAPRFVKGTLEFLPWLAVPPAGKLMGMAGVAGRGGAGLLGVAARGGVMAKPAAIAAKALQPAAALERAIAYPVSKPLELLGKKIAPKATEITARLIPDLQPVDEAIAVAIQPDRMRNLVNVSVGGRQPLRALGQMIGGRSATAKNPAELSLVGRDILRFEGANKATIAIATLNRMGSSRKLFNLNPEGLMTIGGEQVHLNTIRTYPQKYIGKLTEPQRSWIRQASLLEKEKKALLDRYGIKVRELTFEEGGEYAGRRVVGKFDSQNELTEIAYIGRGQPGKPGAKLAAEKTRIYSNIDDAIKDGFRYLPEEEALYYNTVGAYNRVADLQWTNWFLEKVPHRTVAVTGQMAASRAEMKEIQGALKQLEGISLKLKANQPVTGQMLKGIKAYYPKEYEQIKLLVKQGVDVSQRDVDDLLRFTQKQRNFYKKEWAEVTRNFKEARQSAMRPGFTGTQVPDIPAFAGKVFTGPESKEWINIIRKELNPKFNSALNAINQVNAVGRFFALAGDASPFGIQLIFLAGYKPKVFVEAMGGFVKAFFDPLYLDNLHAKHIGLIQKHVGLTLTKGGTTEMTELAARGGLLRKGPFKILGKPLEPFMRGFEGSLDTAGIKLAVSLDYLATTPVRTAQVDAFINEFRGLLNTTRLGISSSQRQIERALVLAPQYNRAIGALVYDIAQGNLRGQLARRAVAQGTAAIMAMTVAVSYALGEDADEIADHLDPTSPNFMTFEIAGQRIGPGSKVRSLLYLFGKMTSDPDDMGYYAGRFMRGNFSPVLGTSMDLITGKNYIGDPTRDGLPSLAKTIIGENLLPIWVQSVAFEGGEPAGRITRALAEFTGARGYPRGAYGDMRALQDQLAQQKYKMSWDELGKNKDYGKLYQMQLTRENPELEELSEKAEEDSGRWARGDQLIWNEYNAEIEHINQVVNNEIDVASKQFDATGDGRAFRERVNNAFWLKAQMRDALLDKDDFSMVREYYNTPLNADALKNMSPQDIAYRDYNMMMYSPDMYDQFGEYRWDEADKRREKFIQQYGVDAIDYVESLIGERRIDEPEALKMLRYARKVLEPYWEIENQIWAQYPPEYKQISDQARVINRTQGEREEKRFLRRHPNGPTIMFARRKVALLRRRLKLRNREIANMLQLFYSY